MLNMLDLARKRAAGGLSEQAAVSGTTGVEMRKKLFGLVAMAALVTGVSLTAAAPAQAACRVDNLSMWQGKNATCLNIVHVSFGSSTHLGNPARAGQWSKQQLCWDGATGYSYRNA
jgi:hypothetical protein